MDRHRGSLTPGNVREDRRDNAGVWGHMLGDSFGRDAAEVIDRDHVELPAMQLDETDRAAPHRRVLDGGNGDPLGRLPGAAQDRQPEGFGAATGEDQGAIARTELALDSTAGGLERLLIRRPDLSNDL